MDNRYTILGPPGTGKTTALSRRVFKAVFEEDIPPSKIVIASLTKTAAREIAQRVRSNNVDLEHVGTLHSIARRAMLAVGRNVDMVYKPELIDEFNKLYNRRLPRSLGQFNSDMPTNKDALNLGEISRRLAVGMSPEIWPSRLQTLYYQWYAFKDNNSVLDFDDLIMCAQIYCREHPAKPELLIVDEAQDLSAIELQLVSNWSEHCKTIIAGDDQQALYEWRGASVKDFMRFSKKENRHVLAHSYRMREQVFNYANKVGDRIKVKIEKEYEPKTEGGSVRRIHPSLLIQRLRRAIDNYDSVMLLATCGYMLNPWLHELKRLGIPYHNPYRTASEGKTWNPLNSNEAKVCRTFLRPYMSGSPRWTWKEVMTMAGYMKDPILLNQEVYNKMRQSGAVFNKPEIMNPDFIKAAKEGNLKEFVDHMKPRFRSTAAKSRDGMKPMTYCSRVGPVNLFKDPKLIVGTVHSVKGGQADSVFLLPGLSPSAAKALRTRVGRDSVHRTMYVGASRAKTVLNLIMATKKMEYTW